MTSRANRIAVLEDRIAELEQLLGIDDASTDQYRKLRLPRIPRKMLGYLLKRPIATREGLFAAAYSERNDNDQPLHVIGAVGTRIWALRNALEVHGVKIRSLRDGCWSISAAHKKRLAEVVASLPEDTDPTHTKKHTKEFRRYGGEDD